VTGLHFGEEMMALHDELLALIEEESEFDLIKNIDDRTSLIKSGIFDSRALFNLAVWIQEKIGTELDFTQFELAEEWDTIENIIAFIKNHRAELCN
jgi:acyl carrier protein